jgi:hypothetical protein
MGHLWKNQLYSDLSVSSGTSNQFEDISDQILTTLNRKERNVIVLEYEESKNINEIAEIMSMTKDEVTAIHYWAMIAIRREFIKYVKSCNYVIINGDTLISDLPLSEKVIHSLNDNNIKTYGELLENIDNIRNYKYIGDSTYQDIKAIVAEVNENNGKLVRSDNIVIGTDRAKAMKKLAQINDLKESVKILQSNKFGVSYSKLLNDLCYETVDIVMGNCSLSDSFYNDIVVMMKKDLCKKLGLIYQPKMAFYKDEYESCIDILKNRDYVVKIKEYTCLPSVVNKVIKIYGKNAALEHYYYNDDTIEYINKL